MKAQTIRTIRRIEQIGILCLILLLSLFVASLTLPRLWGYDVYIVKSDSMTPVLSVGDLALIQKASFEDMRVGDIATFQSRKNKDNRFTHRIFEINTGERTFTTKGDGNPGPDPAPAPAESLIGKMAHSIPFAGYPALWIQNPVGFTVIVLVTVLCIAIEIERKISAKKKGAREYD